MSTPRIVVIGSANVDLTTFVDRFPRAGETIFAERFDLGFGGKGANQAVAARLCGVHVDMVARVGNDLSRAAPVDYLIPNETEAEVLGGLPAGTPRDAERSAHALVERGFSNVIVTLGELGAVQARAAGTRRIPPFVVTAQDTTGAGDAFIGSFAVFLAEGRPEAEALARANLYAALSTTHIGTQKAFSTREQFEREWAHRTGADA